MPKRESEPCHLLHTCKVPLPVKGGIQIVANEIFKALSDNYKSTLVSTIKIGSPLPPVIKNLTYVLKRSLFEFKSLPVAPGLVFSLWRLAKQSSLLVAHYPFPLADLAVGLLPNNFKNIIIYWHSDIFEQKFLKKLISPFTQMMLRKSTVIVVSSPKLIEHSKYLQKFKSKCIVIPFGYSPDSNLVIKDGGYYLCIGRHVKYKGINCLIRAASKISVKILIVGTGPLLNEHITLVKNLNLNDRVNFIRQASDKDIVELISQCRALILPSISPNEAFGLVQIEAMSYAKPIINTELPSAVPWVARNGIEAITVSPDNSKALARAINSLEQDKELRLLLSKNALKRWKTTFTLEMFHSKTKALFNKLCNE